MYYVLSYSYAYRCSMRDNLTVQITQIRITSTRIVVQHLKTEMYVKSQIWTSYARLPFFFLLTTLNPPHSFCAGLGCVFTTSAIDNGFPLEAEPFASVFRLLTYSLANLRPSRVVLLAYMRSDMISMVDESGSSGKVRSIAAISSTMIKYKDDQLHRYSTDYTRETYNLRSCSAPSRSL